MWPANISNPLLTNGQIVRPTRRAEVRIALAVGRVAHARASVASASPAAAADELARAFQAARAEFLAVDIVRRA